MKKIQQAEETDHFEYSFFDTPGVGPIVHNASAVPSVRHRSEEVFLDNFLAAIKWIFLYLPGAAYVHLLTGGLALILFDDNGSFEMLSGITGAAVIGTFMIMLGVGKLNDLRYLRVVAGIFAASALSAILYSILSSYDEFLLH